jgi:hypothetical protein
LVSIRDVNPAFFDRITAQPVRLCERETYTYGDPNRALGEVISPPNPTIVFDIKDYESNWAVMERFSARLKSIGDLLAEMGVDIYGEPEKSDSDALGRERDAPWGFAAGDRVRMTTLGYIGHVTSSEACPFGGPDIDGAFYDGCRRICPNVTFNATHRLRGDVIETVTEGVISCPPAELEHTD